MTRVLPFLICLCLGPAAGAEDYRPIGKFVLKSHFKVTGDRITPVPMKPVVFEVASDGVHVRITADGNEDAQSVFEIYRADGIGRQRPGASNLDIIPGLQAISTTGGVVRHLRLSRETLTITTFPGLSNQTIISHAVPAEPDPPKAPPVAAKQEPTPATTPPPHEASSRR